MAVVVAVAVVVVVVLVGMQVVWGLQGLQVLAAPWIHLKMFAKSREKQKLPRPE